MSALSKAVISGLALTMGIAVAASASAQAPRATSENAQTIVTTVTGTLGTGAVFSGTVANQVMSSPHTVEVLCLDPTAEVVQPLFIGTDLVCVPH